MADIDQILAGGAGASSRADFSGLADLPEAFWKGRDRRFVQEGRDLFANGVPTNPDGSINYAAMRDALFKHGDIPQGTALDNLDIARQQLKFGQEQSRFIQRLEGGGEAPQSSIVSPPSPNRSASTPVAPALNSGGVQQPQGGAAPARPGGTNIYQILDAQGIPNDQLEAAGASIARQLGVADPTQPIDISDPRIRNVLVPAIAQLKRAGVGNVIPAGQPSPPDQVLAQPPQVVGPRGAVQPNAQGVYPSNAVMVPPSGAPVMAQGAAPQPVPAPPPVTPQGQPGPVTNALTGTTAPDVPSRVDKLIAAYAGIMSNPVSPKQNVDLAKARLESLQKSTELTSDQKNYIQAVTQGFRGTQQDFLAKQEGDKTTAVEDAKAASKKYETLIDAGTKAQQEIPQLSLLKEQMNDPNFYSGVGEKYNLLFKRLKSAVGIDPDAAVPQEFFRKSIAASVLASFGALKGLGPIRVAEMNLAKTAAAAPDNSIPANKLLVELQQRTYQRQADIADMAQAYKEQHGKLDTGFDKQVTAYFRSNPIFSDAEIKDYHKAIGEAPKNAPATTTAASANPYEAEMRRRGLLK